METITLDYPIDVEGERIDVITLRRPKARDLKHMETAKGGEIAKSIGLIANLAELPPSAIDDLDASDFQTVSDVVAGFLTTPGSTDTSMAC
ncbi:phage tail assembly protein [Grimontia kaedaensis]|uniref:Phage tail assembly protein n=1 Tax=Grimontia kaedaensis TaxID=2872157 RepID=A0ABY4WP62_9GAMM|nr:MULTISPECIES: phage tail assembly protein [Grimontia]USH01055.1 phage tail assembly protein [Grimontia kaedaensis]